VFVRYQASARELADADLLASALPNIFAVIARFTKAGTNATMKRFSRPGTILGQVFPQCVKALGYALFHAHRLHRHGPRSNPSLASTAVFVTGGGTTVTQTPPRLELVVERFPEFDTRVFLK
jgi:hypothetical protein